MPAAQTAPVTSLRAQVKSILQAEFAADGFRFVDGRMHEAHAVPAISTYPVQEAEGRRVLDQDSAIRVQVFLQWRRQVSPDYVANPAAIEAIAERFREAFYGATHPYAGSKGVWDLRIIRVDYLPDPTGQITRLEATVVSIGQNFAETNPA